MGYEIRFYPACIIASVRKQGDIDAMKNAGFRELAGYIFGGNQKNEKIAMTAPVLMEQGDGGTSKMSFVMPKNYKREDLPSPNSSEISITETEPVYRAVFKFGGFASQADIDDAEQKLKDWLAQKSIKHSNNFVFMSYNPPYQLINRRNEVGVAVQYVKGE